MYTGALYWMRLPNLFILSNKKIYLHHNSCSCNLVNAVHDFSTCACLEEWFNWEQGESVRECVCSNIRVYLTACSTCVEYKLKLNALLISRARAYQIVNTETPKVNDHYLFDLSRNLWVVCVFHLESVITASQQCVKELCINRAYMPSEVQLHKR